MAGAIAARREVQLRGGNPRASFVTVALNRVEFKKPVLVGDVVRFQTSVARIGRTSITMQIDVIAERVQGARALFTTVIRRGEDVLAEVKSTWCCLDSTSMRPARLAKDVVSRFLPG